MDGKENDWKIFVLQRQQQNTRVVICLFWMHSHVNTCYLWREIKNIFPLDKNTIWSCRWLKHPVNWILEKYLMISLPPKCLSFYENCESEKASGRPALIINRTQCWLNISDNRTLRKELGTKKWWFDMYNRIWKHNSLSKILNISICKSILLSFVICVSNVIAHLRQS